MCSSEAKKTRWQLEERVRPYLRFIDKWCTWRGVHAENVKESDSPTWGQLRHRDSKKWRDNQNKGAK